MTVDSISGKGAIAYISGESLTTQIVMRGHELIGDEPPTSGGLDKGPAPRQMLAASIAMCQAMTARLYASRKGWNLEAISVQVDYRKEEESSAEGAKVPLHFFDCLLEVRGNLDDKQKQRLIEIAMRCPVSRVVREGAVVTATLR